MSGQEAGSQELLELETLKRQVGSNSKRDNGNQPSQSSSQLSQSKAELCLHKAKPDGTQRGVVEVIH